MNMKRETESGKKTKKDAGKEQKHLMVLEQLEEPLKWACPAKAGIAAGAVSRTVKRAR